MWIVQWEDPDSEEEVEVKFETEAEATEFEDQLAHAGIEARLWGEP